MTPREHASKPTKYLGINPKKHMQMQVFYKNDSTPAFLWGIWNLEFGYMLGRVPILRVPNKIPAHQVSNVLHKISTSCWKC